MLEIEFVLVVDLAMRDSSWLLMEVIMSVEERRVLEDALDPLIDGEILVGMQGHS